MKNRIIIFFALGLLSIGARAQSNIISTIAGTGTSGYSGDGGSSTAAAVALTSVSTDAAGNIYVFDDNNNRIRKITLSTGTITTIAGNGGVGSYGGDGGAATAAQINIYNSLSGIVVDASGNVYFADRNNSVIRKINTLGTISTYAGTPLTTGNTGDGGAATGAKFNGIADLAIDGSGNIYVSDQGNNRIRKITASTGIINAFAGTGAVGYSGDGSAATGATFTAVKSLAVDGSGNVYICDGNGVREVVASTGKIATFAGLPTTSGSSGDGFAATAARFSGCSGIACDGCGNIYITDQGNNYVRKVDLYGVVNRFAGSGSSGFAGDGGPATAARFSAIYGIAADANANVYVADFGNFRLRKISNGLLSAANSIAGSVTICPGSGVNLSITGGTPFATITLSPSGSITLNSSGNGSTLLTPSTTTSYTGTISLGGCSYTVPGTYTIHVLPRPVISGPSVAHPSCPGITLTVSGGSGPTYTWLPSTFLSASTGASVVMTPTVSSGSINYTVVDAANCTSLPFTVNINTGPCREGHFLSVEDINQTDALKLYPNPNTGTFTIELPYAGEHAMMSVTDLSGRNVMTLMLNANKQNVDMASYPAGIYLMNITMGDRQYHEKIMVQ